MVSTATTNELAKAALTLDSMIEGLREMDESMKRQQQQEAERLFAAAKLYGIRVTLDPGLPEFASAIQVGSGLWEMLRAMPSPTPPQDS